MPNQLPEPVQTGPAVVAQEIAAILIDARLLRVVITLNDLDADGNVISSRASNPLDLTHDGAAVLHPDGHLVWELADYSNIKRLAYRVAETYAAETGLRPGTIT